MPGLGVTEKRSKSDELSEKVLDCVCSSDAKVSFNQITEAVPGRHATLRACLKSLVERGEVVQTGSGQKGDPVYYGRPESAPYRPAVGIESDVTQTRKNGDELNDLERQ